MKSLKTLMLYLVVVLTGVLGSSASGQSGQEAEPLEILNRLRDQVNVLDLQHGRHSPELVESLVMLAQAAFEFNQFEETRDNIDRAIQILRVNQGLYTESQFPLLAMMIENDAKRGDWAEANEALIHLQWLYFNKHQGLDGDLVDEIMHMVALHQEGIAADLELQQPFHFRHAMDLNLLAIRVAEAIWEPNEPKIADLYYNLANQLYLQSVAVYTGGHTGYQLRELIPGSGWVQPKSDVKDRLYRTGLRALDNMRRVFDSASPPDLEAAAMVDVYRADWKLIFSKRDAEETYAQAFENLENSGIESGILNSYFANPVVLPMQDFYSSFSQAMAARQAETNLGVERETGLELTSHLQVSEWSTSFPSVRYPWSRSPVFTVNTEAWSQATLSFDLGAMTRVSRWVKGRYITNVSVARNVEIISQDPGLRLGFDDLTDRIHNVHLRPRLQNGIAQPFQGTLQFQYFAGND